MIPGLNLNSCIHEIDPKTVEYYKRGRIGICRKCKAKLILTQFLKVQKRTQPKGSKKARLKARREKSNG